MTPICHIRKNVFRANQSEFAVIAGVNQSTVSRWESDDLEPSMKELRKIRKVAKRRRLKWRDALFFETPKAKEIPKAA